MLECEGNGVVSVEYRQLIHRLHELGVPAKDGVSLLSTSLQAGGSGTVDVDVAGEGRRLLDVPALSPVAGERFERGPDVCPVPRLVELCEGVRPPLCGLVGAVFGGRSARFIRAAV